MASQHGPQITGHTRLLLVVADPVSHVRTPQAMNALAAQHGADCVTVPCQVAAADLERVLIGVRAMKSVDGLVVTAPHKIAAASLCDRLSERASQVGAVNAIRRTDAGLLEGDVFDGAGFVAGLLSGGIAVGRQNVFMSGAGGAARAIAFALAEAGIRRLVIHNRTPSKALQLAESLRARFPTLQAVAGGPLPGEDAGLVVNASTLGMRPDDPVPLDVSGLSPAMIVADVIMQPEKTALLEQAERRGCRIQPGKAMLDHQLVLIARFLGVCSGAGAPGEG